MYANINNTCKFVGRMVKDAELSYIPVKGGAEQMAKAKFTVAVDKVMNKQQKETAKQNNQPTADFIQCEIVGKRAETLANFFPKGKPIVVNASFRTFSYKHKTTGETVYSYAFDVDDFGFVPGDFSEQNGGNGAVRQNNNHSSGNNSGYNSGYNNYNDMTPVDDGEMPF